jgi:protein-L-isoaspartate(D-aspartate) O-methyltransferase
MPQHGSSRSPSSEANESLVRAVRAEGVRDERVLDAFRRVRRAQFVPPPFAPLAEVDRPIPIAHGQVTTQPSLVAQMVGALRLGGTERVLEIGTGLGFQTAILAALAREVVSIERFDDLAAQARANLEAAGIEGVTIVVGDGTNGLPRCAPFDAILVSAAAPEVPRPLIEQLADGGHLVQPIGPGGEEIVTCFRKEGERLVREASIVPACFVPLVGEHGVAGRRTPG